MIELNEVTHVYYHGNCPDGMFAAYAIWSQISDKTSVEFIPVQYGFNPPTATGRGILILDVSFSKSILERLIRETEGRLLIIDHHETAKTDLADIPEQYKIFDTNHCGAYLTWHWVSPHLSTLIEWVLDLIEARDLWLENSDNRWQEFNFSLMSEPLSFERFEKICSGELLITRMIDAGRLLKADFDKRVNMSVDKLAFRLMEDPLEAGLIVVAIGNIIENTSDVGDLVLKKFPFVNFYAGYYVDTIFQETQFSFRSRKNGYPVNKLAQYFRDRGESKSGGGHPSAAGCRFKTVVGELPLKIVSRKKITRLAKGAKMTIHCEELGANQMKGLFPDLVTLVKSTYTVIRDGHIVYSGESNDFLLSESDLVTQMKGSYGKTLFIDSSKKISDIPEFLIV